MRRSGGSTRLRRRCARCWASARPSLAARSFVHPSGVARCSWGACFRCVPHTPAVVGSRSPLRCAAVRPFCATPLRSGRARPPPGHAQPPHRRPIGRLARPRRLRVPRHIAPRGAPLPRAGGCAAGCRSIGAARAGPRRAGVRRCAALFPPPARGLRPALWGAHPQGRTPEGGERKNAPIRKLVHIFDPPQRARHVVN